MTSNKIRIELRKKSDVTLQEREFDITLRGVVQRPTADREVKILLFEPTDTRNTDNVDIERTQTQLEQTD